jgi:hypothetical protein
MHSKLLRCKISGFFSSLLENISVPKFKSGSRCCTRLAKLAEQAHKATASGDEAEVEKVSAEIDHAVLEIWELTDADLKEIETGYAEVTKADLETDEEEVEEGEVVEGA